MHGMGIMVEAVSVTLGPKGRNVVLEKKMGQPQIINDGVSIAREIELLDNIENTGVSLIRQAASKTNDVAGDGTTTATVLAYAMVREGMKNLTAGANPVSLKIGMEKALKFLIAQINEYARPVEDLKSISQVASISAGNDPEIGDMIAGALDKVGKDGVISLEEGKSTTTSVSNKAKNLGIRINKNADVISPPLISCHIGSDVTADLISIDVENINENFMLLDVGTNTEIILGNKDNLVAASCPAGPAFEGGEVTYAMPGYDGAIEKFSIDKGSQKYDTINNSDAQGICGSGLIDLLASLKSNSIINELGVLTNGDNFFELENTNGIKLSRSDMSALAQAKAANYCGQSIAIKRSGIHINEFKQLFLSGGFANYINVENAKKIGFLIDTPNANILKIGNSALNGAIIYLLDINSRLKIESIVNSIKHVELETDENFFDHFVEGCQFKELKVM